MEGEEIHIRKILSWSPENDFSDEVNTITSKEVVKMTFLMKLTL